MRIILALIVVTYLLVGRALAEDWSRLVGPDDLARLNDGSAVVLDIRPKAAFAAGHVPNALHAPYDGWAGPRHNPGARPDDGALTRLMQGLGLDRDDRVLITHAGETPDDFGMAARVYWTLKSAGLNRIAILNGGLRGWIESGRVLVDMPGVAVPSTEEFRLADTWLATRGDIAKVVADGVEALLVDSRPVSAWRGKTRHPMVSRSGTLPGALQLTHDIWFAKGTGQIGNVDEVRTTALLTGFNRASDRPLINFCDGGLWSATNWFALSEIAGIDKVKLYPEGLIGWDSVGGELVAGR